MKKVLSIMLALVMVLSAICCINVTAADDAGLNFFKQVISSKSLAAEIDGSSLLPGNLISDISAAIKFDNGNCKLAGKAKVLGINANVLYDGDGLFGYFFVFKINIEELIGKDVSKTMEDVCKEVEPVFEKIDAKYIDFIQYNSGKDETKNIRNYGDVTCKYYGPNKQAICDFINEKAGEKVIEVGTIDAVGEMGTTLVSSGKLTQAEVAAISNILKTENLLTLYYKGNNLVGFAVNLPGADGKLSEAPISTTSLPITFKSISSGVKDSLFKEPLFSFDITGLIKWIVGMF